MKSFKTQKAYLVFMLILTVFSILPGCSGGGSPGTTVSSTDPAHGSIAMKIDNKLTATFSREMDPATITTTTFTVNQEGAAAVPGVVTYSGVTAVFTPAVNLAQNTKFTCTITTGAKDLSGGSLASNHVWTFTTGATLNTIAPTVTGTANANGATSVAANTALGATFSEGMDPATINNTTFTLKETASGTAVAGTVSYSGVSAVFTPSSNLAFSTGYTVTVKSGAGGVKDLSGNPMANDFVISWITGTALDTTAPAVTGTMHSNGATNVAVNTAVGATFSEGMNPLSISNANFTLKKTSFGTAVAGTVSYSGVSAAFIPSSNLDYNTGYTVTVKGGAGGVRDLAGNPMASDFVISWTTGAAPDTTAPTVSRTDNANGATNVAVNTAVGATFSEGMNPLSITNVNFTLKNTATGAAVAGIVSYSGVSAAFIPSSNLAGNTGYTVTVKGGADGVRDLAGNPMASDFVTSWTTGTAPDTSAPTVTGTIHANGATNVAVNTTVGATFSEGMNPLTITNVNFTLKNAATGAAVAGTVSYSGMNAVFTPTNVLDLNTRYTATIKGGVSGAKDLAGNQLASDYVWSWTTSGATDFNAPSVYSTFPRADAVVMPTDTVTVTFSEAMDPLTISTATFTVTCNGGAAFSGTVSYQLFSNMAVFRTANTLPLNSTCVATITSGARDLAGNALASGLIPNPWSFTTAIPDPPIVPLIPVNPTAPVLGEAGRFVILASQAVTTTGTTAVSNGDIGIIDLARSFFGGFTTGAAPGQFTELTTGLSYAHDDMPPFLIPAPYASTIAFINQVRTDLGIANTFLAADPNPGAPTQVCPIELGGRTLTRGVYKTASNVGITTGPLHLDAQGDPNSVFIFSTDGTLTTGASGSIILDNGAQAKNVYFRTAGVTTIAAGTTFYGNVFAATQVNVLAGANVTGRLFALTDRVTLIADTVTKAP